MSNSVWILTREVNDYNQDGEYFVKVFADKPSKGELKSSYPLTNEEVENLLLHGGGRLEIESEWYYLREYQI